jgi:hypothetical protein
LHAGRQLRARIEGLEASEIGPMTINGLRSDLAEVSEAISDCFFLQAETADEAHTKRLF